MAAGSWTSGTPESADTFLFRKVRPIIEGTIDNDYDFRFMPEFGRRKTIILDAFVTARLLPWLAVQAGKFKGPVGLERLQPDQYNRFVELGLPSAWSRIATWASRLAATFWAAHSAMRSASLTA